MEETSLEDFLETGSRREELDTADRDDRAATPGTGDGVDEAGGTGAASNPSPSPAVTAAWSPAGGTCSACGEDVAWRFRQDDELVCPDCKDW